MKARIAIVLLVLAILGLARINYVQAQVIEKQRVEIRYLFEFIHQPINRS